MFSYYLFPFKRRKRSVQMTNEDKSLCSVWKLIRMFYRNIVLFDIFQIKYIKLRIYISRCIYEARFSRPAPVTAIVRFPNM